MGPTATIPFSHYWTKNHEEDHDSYATDHLDFDYQIEGLEGVDVSGRDSAYTREDIENQTTEHDARMAAAVTDTGWPVCRQWLAGPLKGGSVILYSHNLFHRGNHRRDHWSTWETKPRFMWRFWLYRTHEPLPSDVIQWNTTEGQEIYHLCKLLNPDFEFEFVTVNKFVNAEQCVHHHDTGNKGLSRLIMFGPFEGGALVLDDGRIFGENAYGMNTIE